MCFCNILGLNGCFRGDDLLNFNVQKAFCKFRNVAGNREEHEYVLVDIFKDGVRIISEGLDDFDHELVFHSGKHEVLLGGDILLIGSFFLEFDLWRDFIIELFGDVRVDESKAFFGIG
jgi:hypothetical protein